MKFKHDDVPDRINQGGVRIQSRDCGDLNVSHICFPAGADARPLLQGLPGNLCQVPHWGVVLEGSIKVEYAGAQGSSAPGWGFPTPSHSRSGVALATHSRNKRGHISTG